MRFRISSDERLTFCNHKKVVDLSGLALTPYYLYVSIQFHEGKYAKSTSIAQFSQINLKTNRDTKRHGDVRKKFGLNEPFQLIKFYINNNVISSFEKKFSTALA